MEELKDGHRFFIGNCTNSRNSVEHYTMGPKGLVNKRLRELVDGFKDIYDYDDPEVVEGFISLLKDDAEFKERDGEIGGHMFSNAISSYLNYLNARKYFSTIKPQSIPKLEDGSLSLQQIFYGAPGTGKSHKIKIQTENESVVRTTFHPDSDYSTFVGCYKPTMEKASEEVFSLSELKDKLKAQKASGDAYPCHKFAAQYWYSLSKLSASDIKKIVVDCGFTESMCQEINKGCAIGKYFAESKKGNICYTFVAQAFLHAYVKAWKYYAEKADGNPQKQYLIIEEINRGNCAQIFGDLFQLLDRNSSGFSDYYIHAETDLRQYLSEIFKGLNIAEKEEINAMYNENVVDKVLSGEILLLPNNLYIWATMNTSDQSLFPIDSAFKRRWDWKYVPIGNVSEKKWKIVVGEEEYDWWGFLEKINIQIGEQTNSEDKKLGFFFCNANSDDVIDANMFVGKVLFYLWNDVFKDYEFEGDLFVSTDKQTLTFDKFYKGFEAVNEDEVNHWLKKLMSEKEPPQTSSAMDS